MTTRTLHFLLVPTLLTLCLTRQADRYESCLDAQECATSHINDKAQCDGYESCFGSTIKTSQDISCGGPASCKYANKIETSSSITCSGFASCWYADSIVTTSASSNILCSGHDSCRNSDMTQTNANTVQCTGAGSCWSTDISNTESLQCGGEYACSNTELTGITNLQCSGYKSCDKAKIDAVKVDCRGRTGCLSSVISSDEIWARGQQSMESASITAHSVYAYGYKSLYKATISTSSSIKVDINGYEAGKYAKMYCKTGQTCHLNCNSNGGCHRLYFYCSNGAHCTISPAECAESRHSNGHKMVDGVLCPNYYPGYTGSDEGEYYDDVAQDEEEIIIRINDYEQDYDSDLLEADVDFVTPNINKCDDAYSCITTRKKQNVINGYKACIGCDIVSKQSVYCNGEYSCLNATRIVTNKAAERGKASIVCKSKGSCYGAKEIKIENAFKGNIECYGPESCSNVKNIQSSDLTISCNGDKSCKNSAILNSHDKGKVLCTGFQGCYGAKIQSQGKIYCSQQHSCYGAEIGIKFGSLYYYYYYGKAVIYCDGDRSCQNSIISGGYMLYLKGYLDAEGATIIGMKYIWAHGHGSLKKAYIRSDGQHTMFVHLYGHETGNGATIKCESPSVCNIYCYEDGCKGLNLEGKGYVVTPSGCQDDKTLTKSEHITCPNWSGVVKADVLVEGTWGDEVAEAQSYFGIQYYAENHLSNNNYLYIAAAIFGVILLIGMLSKSFLKSKKNSVYDQLLP